MLSDVVDVLRCPVCGGRLRLDGSVHCDAGHSFDVARQGYVNLHIGARPSTADTAAMVAARAEFLDAGHYDAIIHAAAAIAAELTGTAHAPLVVDAGAGTGHWLAAVLDRVPGARGLALDSSKYAARRAARAHEHVGAAVCDSWRHLPVADGVASIVLDVFAPRNGAEFARVMRADGMLLVVTPAGEHLAELVAGYGLLGVDEHKEARLERSLSEHFDLVDRDDVTTPLQLTPDDLRMLVRMGPSAWHVAEEELDTRLKNTTPISTTASVVVSVYRRCDAPHVRRRRHYR